MSLTWCVYSSVCCHHIGLSILLHFVVIDTQGTFLRLYWMRWLDTFAHSQYLHREYLQYLHISYAPRSIYSTNMYLMRWWVFTVLTSILCADEEYLQYLHVSYARGIFTVLTGITPGSIYSSYTYRMWATYVVFGWTVNARVNDQVQCANCSNRAVCSPGKLKWNWIEQVH